MNFSSFFIFEVRTDTNILMFLLCVHTEKERIDSGYFLFQAAQKKKNEKKSEKKGKEDKKTSSAALGAMFEKDSCTNESSFSSDSSDEDFIITQKRKRG